MSVEKHTYKTGKTVYRVRYRDNKGKQCCKNFKTKKEANIFNGKVSEKKLYNQLVDFDAAKMPIDKLYTEYMAIKNNTLKPKTLQGYESIYHNHIQDEFGSVALYQVSITDVMNWYSELHADKATTAKQAFFMLKRLLTYAVKCSYLQMNVLEQAEIKNQYVPRTRVLTPEKAHEFIQLFNGQDQTMVMCFIMLGLRWSELAGLRACDIDTENKTVTVSQQAQEVGGKIIVDTPKSQSAKRFIPIPEPLVPFLAAQLIRKEPEDYVFQTSNGNVIRRSNWRKHVDWEAKVKQIDEEGLTVHDLRRTYGSITHDSGASIKTVSELLGHSTTAITAAVYTHSFDATKVKAANAVGDVFTKLESKQ